MSLIVKVRSIEERVGSGDDARFVTANYGEPVPSELDSDAVARLQDMGAIGEPDDADPAPAQTPARADLDATARGVNPDGGTEGVTGEGGSTSGLPADAPDARDASATELAEFIDSADLNAAQTVALAQDDPDLAPKVIEAEQVSAGGDGRKTVVSRLERLRDRED